MRVRMLTLAAGPSCTLLPGHEYDLADDFARQLLTGKYAEAVRVNKMETAAMIDPSLVLSPKGRAGMEVAAAVSIETAKARRSKR